MRSAPAGKCEGDRPVSMIRRHFLAGMTASGLALPTLAMARSAPFRFGLTPVFLDNDWQLLDLIRQHVQSEMGAEVEFIQRRTYKEVVALLLMGELDAAWLCGYPLLQNPDRLVALALPVWRGEPLYRSYLIVRPDRQVERLADLRGDIHAYSDPDSNSGYLVTISEILALDARPESFFSRSFFTNGHRNVVRSVAHGLARSGSVDGYVWEALTQIEPDLAAQTRVLWQSEPFGFPPLVVTREAMQTPRSRGFAEALARMEHTDQGRRALDLLQLDGFVPPQPDSFDSIAARMRVVAERG